MTDEKYVTVRGPHNRHIDVHVDIQKAFPDIFPLVHSDPEAVSDESDEPAESDE